jgi:hypothetical protein
MIKQLDNKMTKVKYIELLPSIVSKQEYVGEEQYYFIGRSTIIHYEDGTYRAGNPTGDYYRIVTEEECEDEGVLVIIMYEPEDFKPTPKYFKKIPVVSQTIGE